jgi:hypothetical protein
LLPPNAAISAEPTKAKAAAKTTSDIRRPAGDGKLPKFATPHIPLQTKTAQTLEWLKLALLLVLAAGVGVVITLLVQR